jgi:NitT/TauT family transport system substrate-binding protein
MKKISVAILIIFSLFLGDLAQAQTYSLILNWKPEPEFGGFYAAEVEGIFKKKSLDIKIIPGGSGSPTIQMAAAGEAEFAITTSEEIFISRSHGSDIVALFATYQNSPMCILAHEERGFKSIQDIFQADGTLAANFGHPFFAYLKKKFGIPKARVVPYPGGITNFLIDPLYSQQGFVTSEALLAKENGVKASCFLLSEVGYNSYLTVLITKKSFIDLNPELVKSFVAAVREGWRVYLDHPKKTNEFMHTLNPAMSPGIFEKAAQLQKPFVEPQEKKEQPLGVMSKKNWQTSGNQLKEVGIIKEISRVEDLFVNYNSKK